ncbi:MAG: hypothetical protein H6Q13_3528 [Bacteroidetes bacterium]|nr:hypothetical protein [Bacteroidota bacterium]
MKRNYFYLFVLALAGMSSCNNLENKTLNRANATTTTRDSAQLNMAVKQVQSALQKKVSHFDLTKRDTVVDCYHISYIIQDNDEIIINSSMVDRTDLDTQYYAGREVILDIKKNGDKILHKRINRAFFSTYISKKEMQNYSIYYFNFEKIDIDKGVIFRVSLCIPDTDICYEFELCVTDKGDIIIKDVSGGIVEEEDM